MPLNLRRKSKAFSLVGLLAIIGGVLVIVGFFLPWESFGPSTLIRVEGLDNKPVASMVEQTLSGYLKTSVSVSYTTDTSLSTGQYGFEAEVSKVIPDTQDNGVTQFIENNIIPLYTPTPSPTATTRILVRGSAIPTVSGWDMLSGNLLLNFLGGVLVLFGGLALALGVKNSTYMILLGGILAVLGMAVSIGYGFSYGYYMSLAGAILCVISGVVGLKRLPSPIVAKRVERAPKAFLLISFLGIISGILVIFGFFLPWEMITFSKFSGWDLLRETSFYRGFLLNLLGGVLVLLGGTALALRVKNSVYMILVGGILAVLGIHFYISSDFYGYYMSSAGSILCVITGIVGLKMLPSFIVPKRAKKIGKKVIVLIFTLALALTITGALALHDRVEGGPVIASRIYLKLEASQVTMKLDNVDAFGEIGDILKDNELPIINVVTPYDNANKHITVEIGQDVTKEGIENLIDNLAQVISITGAVSSSTLDKVAHILSLRVDPHGTISTDYTSVGSNLIRFEVGLPLENAIKLLDLSQGLPVVVSIESTEQLNPPT